MNNIAAVGHLNPGFGLSKAFDMNVQLLQGLFNVTPFGITEQVQGTFDTLFLQMLGKELPGFIRNNSSLFNKLHTIGYVVWESSLLPQTTIQALQSLDEVWTASEFCRSVIEPVVNVPVRVLPHYATVLRRKNFRTDKLTFLSMFDGGSRILRKNPFALIRSFKNAFGMDDDVRLVLKVKNVGASFLKWAQTELAGYDVVLIDSSLSEAQLHDLYDECHVYVSTHCAEGFGLPMLEAMAHGKMVIATNWSGNVDFVTPENGMPVDFDLVPCQDKMFPGKWAMVREDHLTTCLRTCFHSRELMWQLSEAAFRTALEHTYVQRLQLLRTFV